MSKFLTLVLIFCMKSQGEAWADEDWKNIGKTENGLSVFATNAEGMTDGSLRMFLRAEKEMERKPEGLFAMFKKPEKYIEKVGPISLLVHCKKRAVREYKAGNFGAEFYIPWEPVMPGTFGSLALNAYCKK